MYNPIANNLYLNKNILIAKACSPLAKLTNHGFKSYLLNPKHKGGTNLVHFSVFLLLSDI